MLINQKKIKNVDILLSKIAYKKTKYETKIITSNNSTQ